jgi:hypothetical protein
MALRHDPNVRHTVRDLTLEVWAMLRNAILCPLGCYRQAVLEPPGDGVGLHLGTPEKHHCELWLTHPIRPPENASHRRPKGVVTSV